MNLKDKFYCHHLTVKLCCEVIPLELNHVHSQNMMVCPKSNISVYCSTSAVEPLSLHTVDLSVKSRFPKPPEQGFVHGKHAASERKACSLPTSWIHPIFSTNYCYLVLPLLLLFFMLFFKLINWKSYNQLFFTLLIKNSLTHSNVR